MTIEETERKEAEEFYDEFKGEPLWLGEEINDRGMPYVEVYRKMPVSFGFEIEQNDADICPPLRRVYHWHRDGSGPLETTFGPGMYPGRLVHTFIKNVKEYGCVWFWRGEYMIAPRGYAGCGSHVHFRPRDDVRRVAQNWVEAWCTTFNTLVECVPLVLPFFAWGRGLPEPFTFRETIIRWARLSSRRLNPLATERFLDPTWSGRTYDHVTFNERTDTKPLTLEIRVNESHPAIAYAGCIILNRIIRRCIDRGFVSPKLRERNIFFSRIEGAIARSIEENRSIYETLENVIPPPFEPGRQIPLLRTRYDTYMDLFDDIIENYIPPYPPLARTGKLFLERYAPSDNPHAVWDVLTPRPFTWEEGPPVI